MAKKQEGIVINYETWKDGIAPHPTLGMGDIVNMDIFSTPGIAKIDYAPTKIADSSDVTDGDTDAFQCCSIDTNGNAVIGTDQGDVFTYNGSTFSENAGSTGGDFQHSVEWKGYTIFADYDNVNDRIKLTAYATSLAGDNIEYAFETMDTNSLQAGVGDYRIARGALIVGDDDVLYVGSGRYVGSLTEDTTFDPTDSGTYTWNSQALDLREDFEIDGFVNFNDFLLISAGNPKTREQALFPWDRVSASFNYPTILNEGVVAAMYSKENLAYFLNGPRGRFMVTNRSVVEAQNEFRNITFTTPESGISQKDGTVAVVNDTFYIGVSNNEESANKLYPVGVYKMRNSAYTRCTISPGVDGEEGKVLIHFIEPFEYNKLLVGWETESYTSGTDYGIDEFGKDGYRYAGYSAKMESPFYSLGTPKDQAGTFNVQASLAKPLATGQGVRISYRDELSEDWTELATFDYATYGAKMNFETQSGIIDAVKVQFRIELTTGSNSTTTPELIDVRIN